MNDLPVPTPVLAVTIPFLNELVILLVGAVLVAYVCYRLRLVPIAGFLITGVLIGPGALGLVVERELIDVLAEVGVVLLLFTIGIEFSFDMLARLRNAIFVAGGVQVGLCIAVVAVAVALSGGGWGAGIYTGCLVALSSTAIVLGLLTERDETESTMGRLSLAILIFQDLAIVLMVLLVPILAGQAGSLGDLVRVLGTAALLIGGVLVLARRIVPLLLERIAHTRRQELFLLTVVAICFGTAAASALAGVSLALGAFLAGLIVSESHYREQALSEILPMRVVFSAVFFVSVGMLLDLRFLIGNLPLVLAIAAGLTALKLVAVAAGVLVLGYPLRIAVVTGITLSQIGEFSFVLERSGRAAGLSPAALGGTGEQLFLASTVLLMLLTPFAVQLGPRIDRWLGRRTGSADGAYASQSDRVRLEDHVIVVGHGPAGAQLTRVLRSVRVPFTVIDFNPATIDTLREQGVEAIYGDAGRSHILELAGVEQAKMVVVVINDAAASRRIVQLARFLNPTLEIIARTRFLREVESLRGLGADVVVPEEMETTVRIFSRVLDAYLIPKKEIERHARELRAEDYGILRGSIEEAHLMVLEGLTEQGLHTRAVTVRSGSAAAGTTLEELALRRDHRLTVLSVRRGDRDLGGPDGRFRLEPDDRLLVVGSAEDFAAAAELFRAAPPAEPA